MSEDVTTLRLDNLETRMGKHDAVLEKMSEAQTCMMISLAKLHSSVKMLLMFIAASIGIDVAGLM